MSRKCIECQYACREKECFGSLVREYCTVDNMTLCGNDLYNGRKDCPLEKGENASDLVIRGIGLPSEGRRVLVVESTGDVWIPSNYTLTLSYGDNVGRLKAIELGPHGTGIDVDATIEDFCEKHCRNGACDEETCDYCAYPDVLEFFEKSKHVLLEANTEGEKK